LENKIKKVIMIVKEHKDNDFSDNGEDKEIQNSEKETESENERDNESVNDSESESFTTVKIREIQS